VGVLQYKVLRTGHSLQGRIAESQTVLDDAVYSGYDFLPGHNGSPTRNLWKKETDGRITQEHLRPHKGLQKKQNKVNLHKTFKFNFMRFSFDIFVPSFLIVLFYLAASGLYL